MEGLFFEFYGLTYATGFSGALGTVLKILGGFYNGLVVIYF